MTAWQVLGIERTSDVGAIRRAYADILKRNRPDDDPEAFTILRAAYESALAQARAAASQPTPEQRDLQVGAPIAPLKDAAAGPGAVPADSGGVAERGVSAAPQSTDPVRELYAAFSALQAAALADGSSPQTLLPLLEVCLGSPALQNVSVQLEFEARMMMFLLRTQPRTELLLGPVIERWKLRERREAAGAQARFLVSYADNVKHVRYLEEFEPRTYRALSVPPRWTRWLEIVVLGLDEPVRAALTHFGSVVPRSIDPAALAWWSRFFTTPHIRPSLVRSTGGLGILGAIVGAIASDSPRLMMGALLGGGAGLVMGALLAGLWLLAIDLPRHRLKATRRGASMSLRAGWLPAGLALCLVAAFCPDTRVGAMGIGTGAVAILVWSVLMAPELRDLSGASVRTRLLTLIIVNAPLSIWWFLLADEGAASLTLPMWIANEAALVATTLGQPILGRDFLHLLGAKSRQLTRAIIAASAIAVMAAVYFNGGGRAWFRLLLIVQLAIVLAQRIAVSNLTEMQRKIRVYVAFYGSLLFARAFGDVERALTPTGISTMRLGTLVFMGGVLLTTVVCMYNERRGLEEETAVA